jgi:hypothetical protein
MNWRGGWRRLLTKLRRRGNRLSRPVEPQKGRQCSETQAANQSPALAIIEFCHLLCSLQFFDKSRWKETNPSASIVALT